MEFKECAWQAPRKSAEESDKNRNFNKISLNLLLDKTKPGEYTQEMFAQDTETLNEWSRAKLEKFKETFGGLEPMMKRLNYFSAGTTKQQLSCLNLEFL